MSTTTSFTETKPDDGFVEYHRTRDPRLRDDLVEQFLPVAYAQARRYLRPSVALDDLRQVALIGLLKAVERFDPHRGTRFVSFAVPTVVGEIKRYYRDSTWRVRPPRQILDAIPVIERAVERVTQRLGRPPTVDELVAATGLSADEVVAATVARDTYRRVELPEELSPDLVARTDEVMDSIEDRVTLAALLSHLPPRDRAAVVLRFFDDLSQSEIARRLGISQMHVSRVLARSLETLRVLTTFRDGEAENSASRRPSPAEDAAPQAVELLEMVP